jgi:hypothetical protein
MKQYLKTLNTSKTSKKALNNANIKHEHFSVIILPFSIFFPKLNSMKLAVE